MRESLILLRKEGLVQVFPQIGSFVSLVDLGRVAERIQASSPDLFSDGMASRPVRRSIARLS